MILLSRDRKRVCSKPLLHRNSGAPTVHRIPPFLMRGYFQDRCPQRASHPSSSGPCCARKHLSTPCSAVTPARVLSPQAPMHSTERGCWEFPYSPWHSEPSYPPSACPGTPHRVSLSPFTSFPINTRPGSQPPAQPLGGNGPESMAKG